METEQEFKVYRGLQRPFRLFGLKGINIAWGFGGGLVSFVLFGIGFMVAGMPLAIPVLLVCGGFCVYKILYHNKYGLHNKDLMKGTWYVKNLIKPTFR